MVAILIGDVNARTYRGRIIDDHFTECSPEKRPGFDTRLRGILQVVSRGLDTSVVTGAAPVYRLHPVYSHLPGRIWRLTGPAGVEYHAVGTYLDNTPPSTGKPILVWEHMLFPFVLRQGGLCTNSLRVRDNPPVEDMCVKTSIFTVSGEATLRSEKLGQLIFPRIHRIRTS